MKKQSNDRAITVKKVLTSIFKFREKLLRAIGCESKESLPGTTPEDHKNERTTIQPVIDKK